MLNVPSKLNKWLRIGLLAKNKTTEDFSNMLVGEKCDVLVLAIEKSKSRYGNKKLKKKSLQNHFSQLKKLHNIDILGDLHYRKAKDAFYDYIDDEIKALRGTQRFKRNLQNPNEPLNKLEIKVNLSECFNSESDWNAMETQVNKLESDLIPTLISMMKKPLSCLQFARMVADFERILSDEDDAEWENFIECIKPVVKAKSRLFWKQMTILFNELIAGDEIHE